MDEKQKEKLRIQQITAMCAKHGLNDLARQLIEGDKTVEEAKDAVLEIIESRGGGQKTTPAGEQKLDLSDKDVKAFSLSKALLYLADKDDARAKEDAAHEIAVSAAFEQKTGKRARGLFIPPEILVARQIARMKLQRALTVGSATAGGNIVATENLASEFIDLLRNQTIASKLGVRFLNGLQGDLTIPRQTGSSTAYWIAEGVAITSGSQLSVGQVAMSPKTVGAYTDFSRKLLLQSSPDVDMLVQDDLLASVGLEVDRVLLYGTGADGQPTGLKATTGINTKDLAAANPTFAEIVELESLIAADNAAVEQMLYLMRAEGRGALKTTEKASSTAQFIWEPGNTVNGYGAIVSNQVESGDFFFGNWKDAMIGFWSGIDLNLDKAAEALAGTHRYIAHQDMDVAFRNPVSFVRANNTL